MSATAKNLAAIQHALDRHAENCGAEVVEIRMSPFEIERLGWEEYRGIPILPDPEMGTGRFRLVCEVDHGELEPSEAVEREALPA